MKIDKHNKDVRLVKIEELAGKKLIPTSLVLFHSDYENCKVEVYILNQSFFMSKYLLISGLSLFIVIPRKNAAREMPT